MTPVWAQLGYLAAAVCFIVALKGLSSPRTARRGNLIGAAGAVLACVIVFLVSDLDHLLPILAAIAAGTTIGVLGAYRVQMTQMPQLVALFNGVGGGAAAIVALIELTELGASATQIIDLIATAFTIVVGSVSFAGSVVTFLKLQELMTTRPVVFRGYPILYGLGLLAALGLSVGLVLAPSMLFALLLAAVGAGLGILLVLPVGGADVPIVISLLNAFTGLTVAASGYLLQNILLLVAGTLVGSAGTLLTRLMANAMGRSLINILFGALKGGSTLGATTVSDRPVKSAGPADVAILLAYAQRVIIVPRLRARGCASAARAASAGRPVDRTRHARRLRHPSSRRPNARAHERAACRGPGPVRAAQGDGRDRSGVQAGGRGPGGRRE